MYSFSGFFGKLLKCYDLLNLAYWESIGAINGGLTTCPLCGRRIQYLELHKMINLEEELALLNAGAQIAGATRSTVVNLFHLLPMQYKSLQHIPTQVAWGHATCNTKLGQRRCHPLPELIATGEKVALIRESGLESFGWISQDWDMIRSPRGAVWIRICDEFPESSPSIEVTSPSVSDITYEDESE